MFVVRRHLPTDEITLRSLAAHHPLPEVILEFRQLQNIAGKFVDADWVVEAAGRVREQGGPDFRWHAPY